MSDSVFSDRDPAGASLEPAGGGRDEPAPNSAQGAFDMRPSCTARLVQPFSRFLSARRLPASEFIPDAFLSAGPDGRIPRDAAHAALDRAVECLRDVDLGLEVGRTMRFGEGGPFDYALRSAATLRTALEVAARYAALLADSFFVGFETTRSKALIRLDDGGSWTRPAADFAMSAFYKVHLSEQMPAEAQLECWFTYAAPRDTSQHRKSFPRTGLRFGAPFFAFAFKRGCETAPMPGADALLHAVHCEHVEALLAHISAARAIKPRVRRLIDQEIQSTRTSTCSSIASSLLISRRTMSRRLEREGTSFAEEFDHARRERALLYLNDAGSPLKEVSFRLGFSHVESFYRAFRRWTGETPASYRRRMLSEASEPELQHQVTS